MNRRSIFSLRGTRTQQQLVLKALSRCKFPWSLLQAGLGRVGKKNIPVTWADLSSQGAWGLAYFDGRIELEQSLVSQPDTVQSVFLYESAHMVDFFYLTDAMRQQIYAVYHTGRGDKHKWYDNPDYFQDLGEAFMGGFAAAYSDLPPDPRFKHKTTPFLAAKLVQIITPTWKIAAEQDFRHSGR